MFSLSEMKRMLRARVVLERSDDSTAPSQQRMYLVVRVSEQHPERKANAPVDRSSTGYSPAERLS